jgi:hypothetical protein
MLTLYFKQRTMIITINRYALIQRGGGTGPMKPGNPAYADQVPIPAEPVGSGR